MKDDIKHFIDLMWEERRGSILGVFIGIFTAVLILLFGFWRILFVALFAAVGLWLGMEADRGNGVWFHKLRETRLKDILNRK